MKGVGDPPYPPFSTPKQDQVWPGPIPEEAIPRGWQISWPQSPQDSVWGGVGTLVEVSEQSKSPLPMFGGGRPQNRN